MADNLIKISRRLTLPTLALAWLFVFAVPVVLLQISLDYLFGLTLQANKQAATGTLISEMASFRRDLATTAYIDRKLSGFFARTNIKAVSPMLLSEQIASEANLQPAGIITHAADTQGMDYYFDEQLTKQVNSLPRALMRRYFVAVNQQYRYDYLDPAAKVSVDSMFRYVDQQKSRKDSESFFRRHFGLIAEMPLLANQCCKSISAKLGGVVYFYYHPLFVTEAGKTFIRGGHLLIFRGADVNWQDVWKNTSAMPQRGGVKRGFVSLPTSLLNKNKVFREIISRFSFDQSGLKLTSTVADVALVDAIQCGTLVPLRLNEVLAALPLLRVSMPLQLLQHPLSAWTGFIGLLARLFALTGAVFLLRIFFFGLDFKLSISAKVLLGTAVMLLLPVVLLLTGFATWNQFHRVYGWYQAEERQRLFFAEFQESFNNYLAIFQKHSLALAEEVAKKRNSVDADLEKLFASGLTGSIASDLYFERKDGWKFHLQSRSHKRITPPEEESARSFTTSAIINAFDADANFGHVSSDSREGRINVVDSAFVNELISRQGRLFNLSRMNAGSRLSTVFIHNEDKYSPYGLLSFKYFDDTIVRDFIANHFAVTARFSDIKLHFYLAEKAGVGYSLTSLRDNEPLSDRGLLEKISLADGPDSYSWRENRKYLLQARWLNDFPLVVVAKTTAFAGFNSDYQFLALLTGYSIMLLLFVLLVFELIYLRPIREFIRVTEAVAAGSFKEQVNLISTDEFGELKVAFDSMIQGLEQRRKLAHFVSQDVVTAIETEGDASAAPGGVRVAATVVFMQLVSSGERDQSAGAAKLFESLGCFISAGDRYASANGGLIDKVIENTLMLVFRAVTAGENHCLQACRTALQLSEAMREAGFRVKAGIASGNVVSGRIGSRLGKLDYTVIGDTVNMAARLKALADKAEKTGIIIAPGSIRTLKGLARVAFIERTEIKGKSREYPLYELIELRSGSLSTNFSDPSLESY